MCAVLARRDPLRHTFKFRLCLLGPDRPATAKRLASVQAGHRAAIREPAKTTHTQHLRAFHALLNGGAMPLYDVQSSPRGHSRMHWSQRAPAARQRGNVFISMSSHAFSITTLHPENQEVQQRQQGSLSHFRRPQTSAELKGFRNENIAGAARRIVRWRDDQHAQAVANRMSRVVNSAGRKRLERGNVLRFGTRRSVPFCRRSGR